MGEMWRVHKTVAIQAPKASSRWPDSVRDAAVRIDEAVADVLTAERNRVGLNYRVNVFAVTVAQVGVSDTYFLITVIMEGVC